MIAEKTITLTVIRDGNEKKTDVRMRYCAAAEQGFESLSGKSINVFSSTPTAWDGDGKPTAFDPPTANTQDYLALAVAAIISAYSRTNEEPPVTMDDILYDLSPSEISELMTTVAVMRIEWYTVPDVVKPEMKPDGKGKKQKNV